MVTFGCQCGSSLSHFESRSRDFLLLLTLGLAPAVRCSRRPAFALLFLVVIEKQQNDLMHKIPGNNNISSTCKLRLTIPREPELETAQRARRIRTHRPNVDHQSQEEKKPVTSTLRSHPLNRKIIDAPSMPSFLKRTPRLAEFQNFKLKTWERDIKGSVATSSSSAANKHTPCISSEGVKSHSKCFKRQPSIASKFVPNDQRIQDILPTFSARPLDKKILSSKGDIGVFRSDKREATKPMDLNLSTNKRCQQDLQRNF